jgi:hypothetical protein
VSSLVLCGGRKREKKKEKRKINSPNGMGTAPIQAPPQAPSAPANASSTSALSATTSVHLLASTPMAKTSGNTASSATCAAVAIVSVTCVVAGAPNSTSNAYSTAVPSVSESRSESISVMRVAEMPGEALRRVVEEGTVEAPGFFLEGAGCGAMTGVAVRRRCALWRPARRGRVERRVLEGEAISAGNVAARPARRATVCRWVLVADSAGGMEGGISVAVLYCVVMGKEEKVRSRGGRDVWCRLHGSRARDTLVTEESMGHRGAPRYCVGVLRT